MYGYIYLTENLVNGKCYIGQHKADKFDDKYKGSGRDIRKAIDKYGIENFVSTIIEWCEDREQLDIREDYWIKKCNAGESQYFYNVCTGAYGHEQTNETREKIRQNTKVWPKDAGLKRKRKGGWKLSDETRQKLSDSHRGYKLSEEQKQKIGNASKGRFIGRHWKIVDGRRVWYD